MPIAAWIPAVAGVAGSLVAGRNDSTKGLAGPLLQGGLGITGNLLATDAQREAADEALAFQREKEEQRRREWEMEREAKQRQWEAQQRFLSPYRRAGASVLAAYGIDIPEDYMEPQLSPEVETAVPPNPYTLGALGTRTFGR